MKRSSIIIIALLVLKYAAFAGFLAGNTVPYFDKGQNYAIKLGSSILMTGTPFSSISMVGKYSIFEPLSVYSKIGIGTIDYTSISSAELTSEPDIFALGLEYLIFGERNGKNFSFVAEYETASWGINDFMNHTSDFMLGVDYNSVSGQLRTKYRVALNNFNAGEESGDNILSSQKITLATELDYSFTANWRGSVEGGLYLGDEKGLLPYFGTGISCIL